MSSAFIFAPRLSPKEEALLMKRLSLLSHSGMPIPDALASLALEQRRTRTRSALLSTAGEVEGGSTLASSLALHPHLCSAFSIQVIRVGEETGTLADNLSYLAGELDKQARFRGKLAGALAYPILLAFLTLGIAFGLILFVFPKILPLFSGLGAALPLPTRIMLSIDAYLRDWGVISILVLAILSVALAFLFRYSPRLRAGRARLALHVPVLSTILSSYRLSTFARSLGLLLQSGIALPSALEAAGRATGHPLYEQGLRRVGDQVAEGADLRSAFASERALFPGLAIDILSAGEASGSLAEAAFHLAGYYENEFEEATRRLSVLVEPVLMIFMGLVVGFVAVSIILPIYSITNHLYAN